MAEWSDAIGRQIGVLADRDGDIHHVIVGDARGIFIPELENHPLGRKVLRGLRLIHTHLKSEAINQDDITDLSLLRLDALIVIGLKDGQPDNVSLAHLFSPIQKHHTNKRAFPFKELRPLFENFEAVVSATEDSLQSQKRL
jgi:GTP-binding protein HflX